MTATATVPSWSPYCSFWVLELCIIIIIITITIKTSEPETQQQAKKNKKSTSLSWSRHRSDKSGVSLFEFCNIGSWSTPNVAIGKKWDGIFGPPSSDRPKVEGLTFSQLQNQAMTNSQYCKSQKVRRLAYQTCPKATKKPKSQKAVICEIGETTSEVGQLPIRKLGFQARRLSEQLVKLGETLIRPLWNWVRRLSEHLWNWVRRLSEHLWNWARRLSEPP